MEQASQEVFALAASEANDSLSLTDTGGGCLAATLTLDDRVFVVGQDDYYVAEYSIDEWHGVDGVEDPPLRLARDAREALDLLNLLREDALTWRCRVPGCGAAIYTSNRPRVGTLRCGACGGVGVDVRDEDNWM